MQPEPASSTPPAPPADPELRWLAEVYQPDAPQLTLRAALSGCVLGAVMALSNLYVWLKTGWSLGVTITACILAFAFFGGLRAARLTRRPFGALENNAMASVASSAGYMTGGGNMNALGALVLLTGAHPSGLATMAWFAAIASLGVFVAIPVKRQLVNRERLPFPTGTATAETIRALHHGGGSRAQAWLLGASSAVSAAVLTVKEVLLPLLRIPSGNITLPFSIAGLPAARWGLSLEPTLLLFGTGALVSLRIGWSSLLGAVLAYGILAPAMVARGAIATVSYRAIVQWTLWGGTAVLVSSGLLTFALQWRSVAQAFTGLAAILRRREPAPTARDPIAAVECPPWWFPAGLLVLGPAVVFLMNRLFGIPVWAGLLTLPVAVVLGFMAARITGETDTTPTKAFGPLTQLLYGAVVPGQMVPNLMGANVTGGIGLHAADLLTDLKSGYLLGARPRPQLAAQLLGTLVGAAAVVPAFDRLVPDRSALLTDRFPAPGAAVWAGVSEVLVGGASGLHPTARVAIAVGAAVGVLLVVLERTLPARARAFVPSAAGLGLGMVIPGPSSISIFLGATAAALLQRFAPRVADRAILPVASGLIAGESLVGVAVALAQAG